MSIKLYTIYFYVSRIEYLTIKQGLSEYSLQKNSNGKMKKSENSSHGDVINTSKAHRKNQQIQDTLKK